MGKAKDTPTPQCISSKGLEQRKFISSWETNGFTHFSFLSELSHSNSSLSVYQLKINICVPELSFSLSDKPASQQNSSGLSERHFYFLSPWLASIKTLMLYLISVPLSLLLSFKCCRNLLTSPPQYFLVFCCCCFYNSCTSAFLFQFLLLRS